MQFDTPHGDKLRALEQNTKLPEIDQPRVATAIDMYELWIAELESIGSTGPASVSPMVESLNRYKRKLELDLIFDSPADFLYRQKGQLKLDNSVIEEFLPHLVEKAFKGKFPEESFCLGPTKTFSHLSFDAVDSSFLAQLAVRTKDHDFVIGRPIYLKSSHFSDYRDAEEIRTNVAFLAAEIKTNLDKTMFQEASASASDIRLTLPNAKYLLLCEWLDMIPISASVSAIEEVIVLRKAKRIGSELRRDFATVQGRKANREKIADLLTQNPLSLDCFRRFLDHVQALLGGVDEITGGVIERGWF